MTQDEPRWEDDARRMGVSDGAALAPGLKRLVDAMEQPGWVAEDPDEHLLPHIRRVCEEQPSTWSLLGAETLEGIYTVRVEWKGGPPRIGRLRADAFGLIGSFAENDSHVRQRRGDDRVVYDITTGILDGDSPFRGHGHLVRVMVVGAAAAAAAQGESRPR
jgi:hypothetical protein